jgi:small-conductance mechanosensitive channel
LTLLCSAALLACGAPAAQSALGTSTADRQIQELSASAAEAMRRDDPIELRQLLDRVDAVTAATTQATQGGQAAASQPTGAVELATRLRVALRAATLKRVATAHENAKAERP